MGDPRKTRKKFKRPLKIWDKTNIEREKTLVQAFGLKNKREIWKMETTLSKKRYSARSLLALPLEERMQREQELLKSLARLGVLDEKASLDDVLTLTVESLLERRLQTIVWRKGLANTAKQARQFITHGHIAIGGRRATAPGHMVTAEEEKKLGYYSGKKMELAPPVKEEKKAKGEKKKTAKEAFEEAKPKEPEAKAEDVMAAVKAARAAKNEKGEGKEEKPAEGEEKVVEEKPEEGQEKAGKEGKKEKEKPVKEEKKGEKGEKKPEKKGKAKKGVKE
jgi:small subunit ribosomal protein S4